MGGGAAGRGWGAGRRGGTTLFVERMSIRRRRSMQRILNKYLALMEKYKKSSKKFHFYASPLLRLA